MKHFQYNNKSFLQSHGHKMSHQHNTKDISKSVIQVDKKGP